MNEYTKIINLHNEMVWTLGNIDLSDEMFEHISHYAFR